MRKVPVRGNVPAMDRADILSRAGHLAEALKDEPVEAVYLFGSYGRAVRGQGTVSKLSDLDLAIQVTDHVPVRDYGALLLRLLALLSPLFEREDLDVTLLNQAGAALRYEAIVKGYPLYLRRADTDLELKRSARREYLDTQWMREFFHRAFVDRVKEGRKLEP